MTCPTGKSKCGCTICDDVRLRLGLNNPAGAPSRKRKVAPTQEKHLDYASWILDRQEEDRRFSLISRLLRLAEDARNERLEAAAAILFGAAEALRGALNRDRAASHAERERRESVATRHCRAHLVNSQPSITTRCSGEYLRPGQSTARKSWNGVYEPSDGLAEPQQATLDTLIASPEHVLASLEALVLEYLQRQAASSHSQDGGPCALSAVT